MAADGAVGVGVYAGAGMASVLLPLLGYDSGAGRHPLRGGAGPGWTTGSRFPSTSSACGAPVGRADPGESVAWQWR
jgi:hypothetical protein